MGYNFGCMLRRPIYQGSPFLFRAIILNKSWSLFLITFIDCRRRVERQQIVFTLWRPDPKLHFSSLHILGLQALWQKIQGQGWIKIFFFTICFSALDVEGTVCYGNPVIFSALKPVITLSYNTVSLWRHSVLYKHSNCGWLVWSLRVIWTQLIQSASSFPEA